MGLRESVGSCVLPSTRWCQGKDPRGSRSGRIFREDHVQKGRRGEGSRASLTWDRERKWDSSFDTEIKTHWSLLFLVIIGITFLTDKLSTCITRLFLSRKGSVSEASCLSPCQNDDTVD